MKIGIFAAVILLVLTNAAVRAAERLGYPVVTKPYDGNHGRGISIGLATPDEVRAGFVAASEHSGSVIVETYLQGDDHRLLVINGELVDEEQGRRRRRSRRTGRFEFRTTLPSDINPDGISANLADGVLTVTVPRSEAAKPRRIDVRS